MTFKDIDSELIRRINPGRNDQGHKNSFGHVLICAGSDNMTGAAVMATGAALRSGAGLVKVFAPTASLNVIRTNYPCAMTCPMDYDLSDNLSEARLMREISELASWADSVLVGPGINFKNKAWNVILKYFFSHCENLILDASAFDVIINDINSFIPLFKSRRENGLNPVIMTPHIGEMKRIFKCLSDRRMISLDADINTNEDMLKIVIELLDAIIVLKDYKTVVGINDSEWYSINRGNSGMAKGGSGDVLSGLMAGMNAQMANKTEAVIASV